MLEGIRDMEKNNQRKGVGGLKCKIQRSAKSLLRKRFLGEDVEMRE